MKNLEHKAVVNYSYKRILKKFFLWLASTGLCPGNMRYKLL